MSSAGSRTSRRRWKQSAPTRHPRRAGIRIGFRFWMPPPRTPSSARLVRGASSRSAAATRRASSHAPSPTAGSPRRSRASIRRRAPASRVCRSGASSLCREQALWGYPARIARPDRRNERYGGRQEENPGDGPRHVFGRDAALDEELARFLKTGPTPDEMEWSRIIGAWS